MNLVLLVSWNGLPPGFQMVGVQSGQAEIMVRKGLAELVCVVNEKQKPKKATK